MTRDPDQSKCLELPNLNHKNRIGLDFFGVGYVEFDIYLVGLTRTTQK